MVQGDDLVDSLWNAVKPNEKSSLKLERSGCVHSCMGF